MTRDLSLASPWFYRAKAVHSHLRAARAILPWRNHSAGVRILYYHRVAAGSDDLAVAPSVFERQMDELVSGGYEALDVATVWERLLGGQVTAPLVGLCFDDGYLDVAENALPVLESRGLRATVFVATGVTSGTARFSWYVEQPPLMSWDQIVELDAAGTLRFEPHTVTHPNLLSLSDADARAEIVESKRALEERLGRRAQVFCYPAGLFAERELEYVREAGFELAVSSEPGVVETTAGPLSLPRIQIDARDGLAVFRAKLAGAFDEPHPLRAWYRRRKHGHAAAVLESGQESARR